MSTPHSWRKSSRSSNSTNCVEVRDDLAAVRDSKNAAGPVLVLPTSATAALSAAVRSGSLA